LSCGNHKDSFSSFTLWGFRFGYAYTSSPQGNKPVALTT
jgi:hypothetical protein